MRAFQLMSNNASGSSKYQGVQTFSTNTNRNAYSSVNAPMMSLQGQKSSFTPGPGNLYSSLMPKAIGREIKIETNASLSSGMQHTES